jgi:FMN phosphatase YigB (HAD superfamily)
MVGLLARGVLIEAGGVTTKLRGVVFDLDGTLYDKGPLERWMIRRAPLSALRLYRYTKTRTSLAGIDVGSWAALEAETLRRLSRGARAQERWRGWIAETYDPLVLAGMRAATRAYEGVVPLLARLRGGGLRIGLVSDYRGVEARLEALGIDPGCFDFCLVTESEGLMKPAPRAAALTCAGMGAPGAALLMVGDREFADQRFAAAGGMEFLGIRGPGRRDHRGDPLWAPWEEARARLLARLSV